MEKIRVGVIGCGSIAEIAHFPCIKKYPETELVAVCDVNKGRLKEAANKWQVRAFSSYGEMLTEMDLDVVVVATPNAFHREHALAAAQAGAHLLVEKPLAVTNKEAWDIVDGHRLEAWVTGPDE